METPEQHLDDSSLQLLVDAARVPVRSVTEVRLEWRAHVETCAECRFRRDLLLRADEAIYQAAMMAEPPMLTACPTDEEWAAFAADPESEAARAIYRHAEECGRCCQLVACLGDGEPMEREMPELASAAPDWQRRVIGTVMKKPARAPFPYWALTLAASLCIAVTVGLYWYLTPGPEVLLARAYTADRPFAFRLPDEGYGPVRSQKGTLDMFQTAPELRRAALAIETRLRAEPADAAALALKARALLLGGGYSAALNLLEPLHRQNTGDIEVSLSLSGAYFLRAQNEPNNAALDLIRALDLLLGLEKQRPGDRAVLFNIALTWEQLRNLEEAAAAWERYVQQDRGTGFSGEAQRHLDEVKRRLAEREQAMGGLSGDPRAFLALTAQPSPDLFLDTAIGRWLPLAVGGDAVAAQALERLANLHGERSQDPFLREMAGNRHPELATLAKAIQLNRTSVPQQGTALARGAAERLHAAGLRAAGLRARTEELYGLHRSSQILACINAAPALLAALESTPYEWMKAHSLTEQAICLAQAGNFSAALATIGKAIDVAAAARLRVTELRAKGMRADFLAATGNQRLANREFATLLAAYWEEATPPNHAHQVFFHWRNLATGLELRQVAAAFAGAAARAISRTEEKTLAALSWDIAAAQYGAAGYTQEASDAKSRSKELFAALPDSPFKNLFETSAALYQADAWLRSARRGGPTALIERLEQVPLGSLGTDAELNAWNSTLSQLYFLAGKKDEAKEAAEAVIARTSALAKTIPSAQMRRQALAVAREPRAILAELLLTQNPDPRAALAAWQLEPAMPEPLPAGVLYLTLMPLPGGLTLVAQEGETVRSYRIAMTPQREKELAFRLLQDCANRDSSVETLEATARALRDGLFSAIAGQIASKRIVAIETDPLLAPVPLAVLFPERNVIRSFSLGEFLRRQHAPGANTALRALLVSEPTLAAPLREVFANLPEAADESRDLLRLLPGARTLTGTAATPEALAKAAPGTQLLHFSGHATLSGGSGALLLATPEAAQPFAGLLTADAVANQDWRNCRLTVLSACSTGRESAATARQENLARAFLLAGSRSVIAAMWDVDAATTRTQMQDFYRRFTGGASAGEALAQARQQIRGNASTRHPYYWAGFQVFGSY